MDNNKTKNTLLEFEEALEMVNETQRTRWAVMSDGSKTELSLHRRDGLLQFLSDL